MNYPITACTFATSFVQAKLDYSYLLLLYRPLTQIHRHQLVPNTATCIVTKTHKFCHICAVLNSPLAEKKSENQV
jgi:hypothetical protein